VGLVCIHCDDSGQAVGVANPKAAVIEAVLPVPRKSHMALQRGARIFDLVLVSIAFLTAFAISSGSFTWPSLARVLLVRIKLVNIFVFGGYLTLCSAIFSSCGFYLSHRLSGWSRRLREIIVATTLITGVLLVLPFRMALATKEFLILFWLLTVVVLVLNRVVGYHILYFARSHGRNLRHIVIVGEGKDATALADRIEKETTLGYRVVRVINAEEA
jgi:FlaA1/EpsC-like NDP-sugar epimerase